MHAEVRNALRTAVQNVSALLQPVADRPTEPCLVWRRAGQRSWQSEYMQRPSFISLEPEIVATITAAGRNFLDAFLKHHPEYSGTVGTTLMTMNITHDPGRIPKLVAATLWERHGSLQPEASQLETVLDEFAEFIDKPTIRIIAIAPLLNFYMEPGSLPLFENVTLRRLTEDEISALHGGPLWHRPFVSHHGTLEEFTLEGEFDVEKVFGNPTGGEPTGFAALRDKFSQAVRGLRTFKTGRVGFEYIHLRTPTFCPFIFGSHGSADLYIPFGRYDIAENEIELLRQHVTYMFAKLDSALETACSRLADAETRLRPVDAILDAAIGLEALLLAEMNTEARRGELRFRFACHYSTFFDKPNERHEAFILARDIYDLRSAIAHGSPIDQKPELAGKRVELPEAAKCACEVLRKSVKRFLPEGSKPEYRSKGYWTKGLFGLPRD